MMNHGVRRRRTEVLSTEYRVPSTERRAPSIQIDACFFRRAWCFVLRALYCRLPTADCRLLPPSAFPLPFALCVMLCFALFAPAAAMDQVTFRRDGKAKEVIGRLLVEAKDGGLLVMARDGVIWAIPPEEQVEHTSDQQPFQPFTREEMKTRLLKELPEGFRVQSTTHYMVFYNTSPAYAQWCGSLFEQLYTAFTTFWTRKGFELKPAGVSAGGHRLRRQSILPEVFPARSGRRGRIDHRLLRTDEQSDDDVRSDGCRGAGPRSRAESNGGADQPDSRPARCVRTVATIIHEATHQIAFNCGLHTRLSDCPLWFSEGIAEYFETPDLRSAKGWRGIGKDVNPPRFEQFRRYLGVRPANSLETLLGDDTRFRDPKRSLDAYSEAWAITYFLIRQHPKQYVAYLAMLSKKTPLLQDDRQTRIDEFRHAFGELESVDAEFMRYMGRLR